jgi:hypothetical protein
MKIVIGLCISTAAVLAIAWGWFVFMGTMNGLRNYDLSIRSISRAADAVERYVRLRHAWPRSWDDLERADGGSKNPLSQEDWSEIQAYVRIDFDLSLNEVATIPAGDFYAIKADMIQFSYSEHLLEQLRKTIQEVAAAERVRKK